MFDVRNAQSWDGQIEKLQVFGIFLLSDTVEVSYDHSEIVSSIVGRDYLKRFLMHISNTFMASRVSP